MYDDMRDHKNIMYKAPLYEPVVMTDFDHNLHNMVAKIIGQTDSASASRASCHSTTMSSKMKVVDLRAALEKKG